jgi:perosamine synthetase
MQQKEVTRHFFRGRVAQEAILRAMNIGVGDEVIVQAFTCIATPLPILAVGATPIFVDVDARTYNLDPGKLDTAVTNNTKAIMVQHTFGIPADMDRVMEFAARYNLAVIEDCCHTLASGFSGQTVGTMGDAMFSSHRWGKPLVLGAGARATIRGEAYCKRLSELYEEAQRPGTLAVLQVFAEYVPYELLLRPSTFWWQRDLFRFLSRLNLVKPTFTKTEVSGAMTDAGLRMPTIHERWLVSRLKRLDENSQFRRSVADVYSNALGALNAQSCELDQRSDPVFLRYPLLVRNKGRVLHLARKRAVELGDWYTSPVHPMHSPSELRTMGYEAKSCPVAEMIADHIVTLPIHSKINSKVVQRTVALLEELATEDLLRVDKGVLVAA